MTVGAVPTGLAEGQLAVGMADAPPTLWAGVPTSIAPTGRVLLNPVGSDAPIDGAPYVRQDAAWHPMTVELMPGVVDGSDAAPGYVGEILTQTNNAGAATITNRAYAAWGAWVTIASFAIPAGDWDVWCAIQMNLVLDATGTPITPAAILASPNQDLRACIIPSWIPDPSNDWVWWPRGWLARQIDFSLINTFNLGPARVSGNVPTTMLLRVYSYYNTYNVYYLHARRVR